MLNDLVDSPGLAADRILRFETLSPSRGPLPKKEQPMSCDMDKRFTNLRGDPKRHMGPLGGHALDEHIITYIDEGEPPVPIGQSGDRERV